MIWASVIPPLLTAFICALVTIKRNRYWAGVYESRLLPWPYAAGFALFALAVTATVAHLGESSQTSDTEYWGGPVNTAAYYEPWDEEVSCRHPIYCESCSTDSKGKKHCSEYVCGHKHLYDVDYHPAEWDIQLLGTGMSISQADYNWFVRRWGKPEFIKLNHRHVHSIDGNEYVTKWPGDDKTLVPGTIPHEYVNRLQNSDSIFRFGPVDRKKYAVADYPVIDRWHQDVIIPLGGAPVPALPDSQQAFGVLNSRLGSSRQVRVYAVIWKGGDLDLAKAQEAFWQGGNKNELVIAIGVDASAKPVWCLPFSWSKSETLKVETRDHVLAQPKLDLVELAAWLRPEVEKNWQRREFKEFEYVKVQTPTWAYWTAGVLNVLIAAGCVLAGLYMELE